jgi:hypothetical protein
MGSGPSLLQDQSHESLWNFVKELFLERSGIVQSLLPLAA